MRSDQLKIVAANREDLTRIARLAEVVWRHHYPGIISVAQIDYMLKWMYNLQTLESELKSGIVFDQAIIDQELVGFASYGAESASEMKLHKLYVHPQWQRRGIGSHLLAHVEETSRNRGFHKVILTVNKRNENALAAYAKNGFVIRESIVTQIGGGFAMDDFLLEKRL